MSYCVANPSDTLRLSRSSWLVWQQTGPLRAISSLASWKDYWGASALLPWGRVILPHLPMRALATLGPQLCVRQSPELSRRMLRHQKLWGCLPTWTFITRRVSLKHRDISYHQFSWTRSSSLRRLRQCSSWQSLGWCRRHFLRPVATRLHPLHLSQRVVGPNRGY